MASRLTKTPFLQAKRQLAQAAVAAKPAELGASSQVQVTKSADGLTVVSCNNGSPLTNIGVLVKAGSRYETYDSLGASHALKNAVGLSTKSHSAFGVTRNVQQMGTNIEVNNAREYISFSSQVLSSKVDAVADYLLDSVANPAFKAWEVSDVTRRVGLDLSQMDPATRATELLHKAAFRDGLGNSLYTPQHMVGRHGPLALGAYHQKVVTADRSCLFAVGDVPHGHLVKLGEILNLGKGAGPGSAAKYVGGEQRHDIAGNATYVAIAANCAGTTVKEMIAGSVLAKILGVGKRMKYGTGAGQLQKATGSANVTSIICEYADACLIGAAIKSDAASAGELVSKVAAALRSVSVTDAEVKAAKNALTIEWNEQMNSKLRGEILAYSAIHGFSDYMSEAACLDALAQVTVGDVQAAAKKVSSGKLSMGAVGNLGTVPYLDTL